MLRVKLSTLNTSLARYCTSSLVQSGATPATRHRDDSAFSIQKPFTIPLSFSPSEFDSRSHAVLNATVLETVEQL